MNGSSRSSAGAHSRFCFIEDSRRKAYPTRGELIETRAKTSDDFIVEREREIASVNSGAVVIVLASRDDEALPFEERRDARDRVEACMARSELRTTQEADEQQKPTKPLTVVLGAHDAPAHSCLFLATADASARDRQITLDENVIANFEALEIIEKRPEALALMRREEHRNVRVEQPKARIAISREVRAK